MNQRLSIEAELVPPAYEEAFIGAIRHPELFLWDAWSYQEGSLTHLYCLAVNRFTGKGERLDAKDRNSRPFHVRHFVSFDGGLSWFDQGVFQKPRPQHPVFNYTSVWSGSVTLLDDGRKLAAFTGLKGDGKDLLFQQSLAVAVSYDGSKLDDSTINLVSCPIRDRQMIVDCGYFIDEEAQLGHKDGEQGGPILAWRDPFILQLDNELHMFWCAKTESKVSALGHATLVETEAGFEFSKLFEPALMPDAQSYTQLELPKVIYDDLNNKFYLIIATCNRLFEGQSDAEVDKNTRIYESDSLAGPWRFHYSHGSEMPVSEDHMFALTVINADFENDLLYCLAPFTEDGEYPLTLSTRFEVKLSN